jgi:amino-acid racemase
VEAIAALRVGDVQHIGIVACSAEGAALCYQAICREALTRVGKSDHPRITMDSIPLATWMPAYDAGDYGGLAKIMLDSARLLADAGCDFLICPDNSAHLAWEHVQRDTPLPWIHIADAVGAEAQRIGATRVGVLGTRFTMTGPVYPTVLGALGIEVIVPTESDQADVDRIIFDELIDGVLDPHSRARYVEVIDELESRGADAVALACTEIPLLVSPEVSVLPTLDSTRLLASAALTRAIDETRTSRSR